MNVKTCIILAVFFCSWLFASPAKIEEYSFNSKSVPQFEKLEIKIVKLTAEYGNPFSADEIELTGHFVSPSGKIWDVPGFYDGSLFLLRFSPDEAGKWSFTISATDINGTSTTAEDNFESVPSKHHGRIGISPFDPGYLAYSDSTQFIGVGQNMPWWIERYPQFWSLMSANSCNLFTYWIPSWDHALLLANNYQQYDTFSADQIDAVLEKSEQFDIHLIFTIWNYDWLIDRRDDPEQRTSWQKNPFRLIANSPREFFSSQESWTLQKNYYRYIIARWGYSRAIALWQTVSGLDNAGATKEAHQWQKKITTFFKENDPFRHPVTSFVSNDIIGKKEFDATDVSQVHALADQRTSQQTARVVADYTQRMQRAEKRPNGVTSFYPPEAEAPKPQLLHNAVWSALVNGASILPLFSSSKSMEPALFPEVFSQLGTIAPFLKELDLQRMNLAPMLLKKVPDYEAWGLMGPAAGIGWILKKDRKTTTNEIVVSTNRNSTFDVNWYDTWKGTFVGSDRVYASDNRLLLPLPEFDNDIAFVVREKRKPFVVQNFKSLQGWEIIYPNWQLTDGTLQGQAKNDSSAVILSGGHDWTHYAISVAIKLGPESIAELIGRERDGNYYAARFDGNTITISKTVNGRPERIASAPYDMLLNKWFNASFQLFDNSLSVTIGDNVVLSVNDEELTIGGIGLAVIQGDAWFDDLVIERDTTPPSSPAIKPVNDLIRQPSIELSGTKSVDSDTIVLESIDRLRYYAKATDDTSWTITLPLTHYGTNKFICYAVDKSGNNSDTLATYLVRYEGELLLYEPFNHFNLKSWLQINGEWLSDSLYVHETTWQDRSFLIFNQDFGPGYSVGFRTFVPEAKPVYLPFYWQDPDNYYRISLDIKEEDDVIRLERMLDGSLSQLAENVAPIKSSPWPGWISCLLQIDQDHFRVTVNGRQILEASDNTFTHGKTGFGINQVGALFDDLIVFRKTATIVQQEKSAEMLYRLDQNYPNPFNPSTNIRFTLPQQQEVTLYIFNVLGKKVATLVEEPLAQGEHQVEWSGLDDQGNPVSAGVYFYELTGGDFRSMRKMIFAK